MAQNSARPVWKDLFKERERSVGVDFAVAARNFLCLVGLGLRWQMIAKAANLM